MTSYWLKISLGYIGATFRCGIWYYCNIKLRLDIEKKYGVENWLHI